MDERHVKGLFYIEQRKGTYGPVVGVAGGGRKVPDFDGIRSCACERCP